MTLKQKQDIAKGIAGLLQRVARKDPKYTHVFVEEIKKENLAIVGRLQD